MEDRDSMIVKLRPELHLSPATSEVETFQNKVLRPILKFQNEALLTLARSYVHKNVKGFAALKRSVQESALTNASKKDPEFRHTLLAPVVGLMSIHELEFYLQSRAELNKRITAMAVERVISQLEALY